MVADVASSLAARAVLALVNFKKDYTFNSKEIATDKSQNSPQRDSNEKESLEIRHPTVGVVDHVSVLPLEVENLRSQNDNTDVNIAGSVARTIGESLKSVGANVLYYGHAHPSGKELAAVRRD